MPETALSDRLDGTIDALLARGDASAALRDPELAPLARLAADLRHHPDPAFKTRLRQQLERSITMSQSLTAPDVREGFTTVTPYLMVTEPGLADFMAEVFGGVETFSTRGSAGEIHREVRIGDSMIMFGEGGTVTARPAALHVYVEDADAAYQRALDAGAVSLDAPAERPYGERSGYVRDRFGNHWYIATAYGDTHVPPRMRTVTPFFHVRDAAVFIEFLKRAFSAEDQTRHEQGGRVRYAQLRIGDAVIELGESEFAPMPTACYLYVADADLVYEQAIAAGAQSLWPPSDQDYGERMGGVEDAQGNQWFIGRPA